MTKSSPARRTKRVAKKTTKNGAKGNGVIALAQHEADKIRKDNTAIATMKIELANARLQRDVLEKREKELCRLITERANALTADAKEFAESHGIDMSAGKWTLQIDQGQFVRS